MKLIKCMSNQGTFTAYFDPRSLATYDVSPYNNCGFSVRMYRVDGADRSAVGVLSGRFQTIGEAQAELERIVTLVEAVW